MSLVIPYIINMYRFGVLDQLGQLIILIYHICIFGVRDLLEINVVQSKKKIVGHCLNLWKMHFSHLSLKDHWGNDGMFFLPAIRSKQHS